MTLETLSSSQHVIARYTWFDGPQNIVKTLLSPHYGLINRPKLLLGWLHQNGQLHRGDLSAGRFSG